MRSLLVVAIAALVLFIAARAIVRDESFRLGELIDLRTLSNADETQVRVHGRLVSGIKFFHQVHVQRDGTALVLSVTGNLLFLAGFHFSPSFDITVDVPADVTEIRVGASDAVLWRRGDCHSRFQDRWRVWHCDSRQASNHAMPLTAPRSVSPLSRYDVKLAATRGSGAR